MKRILIFEDDCEYVSSCKSVFDNTKFELVHVKNFFEFEEVFYKDSNWDAVLFDAWIEEDMTFTYEKVQSVREELGEQVRLLANSSSDYLNQNLLSYGCEIASGPNKKFDPNTFLKIVSRMI